MTNQQLAILLEGYAGQLARAISVAELEADKYCMRPYAHQHKGMLEVAWRPACFACVCDDRAHYEAVIGPQPITAPLWAVLENIQEQINTLKGESS